MNDNKKYMAVPGTPKQPPIPGTSADNAQPPSPAPEKWASPEESTAAGADRKVRVPDSPLKIDRQALIQGILFSEILSKPRAKRRGRW